MKTRDRILSTALILFNEKGLSEISSRYISIEMGISYGNLCYHFAKKDDLILQLYYDMQREMAAEVANLQAEIFGFDFMVKSLRSMLVVLDKYKFIFLDFAQIVRKLPQLRSHAQQQYQNRIQICKGIYTFLILEGYLKEEKVEGHYDLLAHNMIMILNSWIVDAEIYYTGPEENKTDHYLRLIYRFVSSSLTKEGEEAFDKVYNGLAMLKELQEQSSDKGVEA